jgi:hypothetical protein
VTEAWRVSVPAAEPGPVNRPPSVKVSVPTTEPLRVKRSLLNGSKLPSGCIPNRAPGRIVAEPVSVPDGEHGRLKPKVKFEVYSPSLVTSKLTGVCSIAVVPA